MQAQLFPANREPTDNDVDPHRPGHAIAKFIAPARAEQRALGARLTQTVLYTSLVTHGQPPSPGQCHL
jgi:hypothetical protein